jgi:hypothetical protein
MVALAVLGIATAIVTVALPRAPAPPPDSSEVRVATARREALERGRPITITIEVGGEPHDVTVHVDGSVVADAALRLDRFTGRPSDGAQ